MIYDFRLTIGSSRREETVLAGLSLAPAFRPVLIGSSGENRLSGFQFARTRVTGLKPGANETEIP
jgi:hypothetical protein